MSAELVASFGVWRYTQMRLPIGHSLGGTNLMARIHEDGSNDDDRH